MLTSEHVVCNKNGVILGGTQGFQLELYLFYDKMTEQWYNYQFNERGKQHEQNN